MPIFCNPRPIALGSPSPVTIRTLAQKDSSRAMVIAEKSPKKKDRKAAERKVSVASANLRGDAERLP